MDRWIDGWIEKFVEWIFELIDKGWMDALNSSILANAAAKLAVTKSLMR